MLQNQQGLLPPTLKATNFNLFSFHGLQSTSADTCNCINVLNAGNKCLMKYGVVIPVYQDKLLKLKNYDEELCNTEDTLEYEKEREK